MTNRIVSVVAAICLAVTLVGAGLAACAVPTVTTEALSRMFSGSDNPATPFSHEELVSAAVATRDYTVGSHSKDELYKVLYDINQRAAGRTPNAEGAPDLASVQGGTDTATVERVFNRADETFVLTPEAVGHLDDVYAVVQNAKALLIFLAAVAVVCCIIAAVRGGKRTLGSVLVAAGVLVLAAFIALGAWAAFDFNGFFAAFHSLFFAAGTWTFSYDSLLITMYPTAFWVGMGVVWLAVTCALSVASIAIGARLRRKQA